MVKNLPANAGDTGDMGLIPGLGIAPEGATLECNEQSFTKVHSGFVQRNPKFFLKS